ncbi:MAG: DEAD/DEAH box helicase [Thermoplasmatota archaeon]
MESVFDLLDKKIIELLHQKEIKKPTEPQKKAIPYVLKGNHVLLIAPTGMGKTESALLPIFHNFLTHFSNNNAKERKGISILYITPLRSLNRDMLKRTINWGKTLEINVAVRHGDTPQSDRAKQSRKPPDMLITTPETLQILFTGKRLRKHLQSVQWVVIDEVHELAFDERGAQLAVGLERLIEITKQQNHQFQRIGLSATVGNQSEVALYLGGNEYNKAREVTILEINVVKHIDVHVELPTIKKTDYDLAHRYSMEPISFALLRRCKEMIDMHQSTLLFINTRDGAEILTSRFHLWQKDISVGVHHGSLSKHARIESENDFKSGKLKSLVCTSSLELGIDVGNTDFVIQYNSPREVTRFVQRVGRSGHQIGKTSQGIILTTNPEDLSESLVIAGKALAGELESYSIRHNPLSVLTNQIISIVLEYGKIPATVVYDIIHRSYPFSTLSIELFNLVLQQIRNQRSIWFEEDKNTLFLIKRRNSRQYFLENISMIPDEKTYNVVDISTRKTIGVLDESYVISSVFEGEKFILQGKPWVIVKRDEEEILVSAVKDIGSVPSWMGEDIPVSYDVAIEVGKLRKHASEETSYLDYPCSSKTMKQFFSYIANQKRLGFIVPDDTTITIDYDEKTIIINACFGTKVNETLGRLVSAILAQSIGESVGITSDAYRIALQLPGRMPPQQIKDIFLNTKPETVEYLITTLLKNSTYIRWQLIHAARKFGALRRDFDYKNIGMKRLFEIFEQSPIFDESLDKLIWDRMDVKHTKEILQRIQTGEITIHIQGLSPIATTGFETIRGLMIPQRADRSILMALKKRLEDTTITLLCTNCTYSWKTTVNRADLQPTCSRCHALKICVLKRYDKKKALLLQKNNMTKQEKHMVKRLNKNASLVLHYGKYAILAQMARGVGPDAAARILAKYSPTELDKNEESQLQFLRDILHSEILYARTRGFWDK